MSGEIHHQLANSRADYLVTLPPLLAKVQEAIGHLDIQVILLGGFSFSLTVLFKMILIFL